MSGCTRNVKLKYLLLRDLKRFKETFRLRCEKARWYRIVCEAFIFKSGFQAVILYRIAHFFYRNDWNYIAWGLSRLNQFLTSSEIEYNAEIGPGMMIPHPAGLVVGRGSRIGENVTLFQGVTLGVIDWHPDRIRSFPNVGDNVFIFAGARVLGGIQIGNNVIIGANSVVTTDVPDDALVVGNPSRIVPGKGCEMIQSWGIKNKQNTKVYLSE